MKCLRLGKEVISTVNEWMTNRCKRWDGLMETKHRQEDKDSAKTAGFSQISGQPFTIEFLS